MPLTESILRQVQAMGAKRQTAQSVTQTDILIAQSQARMETDGHLVHFNPENDTVEVYVQVFYGAQKWKLGVLRSNIDLLQGKFVV